MSLYKRIADGYIEAIGENIGGAEITEAEYNEIRSVLPTKPPSEGDTDYRLREDLTWEAYTVEPEPEPDLDDAEAFGLIFGGGGDEV